jgi:hypothetical protein
VNPVVFFLGHGRQGTTFGSHLFARTVDCYNLIESTRDPRIDASVTAFKRHVARALRDPDGREALRRYFNEDEIWLEARRSERPTVCKFPYNTLFAPLLGEVFPSARFVHISRFPPDTVTSIREVFAERRAFNPVQGHPVFGALFDRVEGYGEMSKISRWAWSIRFFEETLTQDVSGSTPLMRVRFEDLADPTSAPEILDCLVTFAGVDDWRVDGDLRDASLENANLLYGGSGGHHPVTGRVGRFAKELNYEENEEIYRVCRSQIDGDEVYSDLWNRYAARIDRS